MPSSNDHAAVKNIFDELASAGFLEQLRLECVADVKTKPTYLNLKKRFIDLLNKKFSSADWKAEDTVPELNIFRQQVVECGVLAITIEKVVDEVVSWKLRENIVPIIKEILCACWDVKNVDRLNLNEITSAETRNFSKLKEVIKKIFDNVQFDWNKVFKNGTIGNSLAAVSFSTSVSQQSDEELYLSDSSGNSSSSSEEELNMSKKVKSKAKYTLEKVKLEKSDVETVNRSKRERKRNTKYSSEIYQTNFISSAIVPPERVPSIVPPETAPSVMPSETAPSVMPSAVVQTSTPIKGLPSLNHKVPLSSPINSVRKNARINNGNIKSSETVSQSKNKNTKTTVKSTESLSPKLNSNSEEMVFARKTDVRSLVRKSERQVKRNTLIFWEPGNSQSKTEPLEEEVQIIREAQNVKADRHNVDDEVTIIETSQKRHKEVVTENEQTFKKKSRLSTSPSPSSSSLSNKRYLASELYKPRYMHSLKSARGRRLREMRLK